MHAFFLGTPVATFQAQRARFVGQRGAREADTAWKCCRLEENTRASYRNPTFWTSANAAEKHMAPDFAFSTKRTAFFRKCMILHRTEQCAQVMHKTLNAHLRLSLRRRGMMSLLLGEAVGQH